MKKGILTSALAIAVCGLATPVLAANDQTEMPSEAKIQLVEDPHSPLRINKVNKIDFGTRKISGNNADYRANFMPVDANGKYRANYIQVVDNRGSNVGWQLQVSASPFKTANDKVLEKTTLKFSATQVKKPAVDPLTQAIDDNSETDITVGTDWKLGSEQVITGTATTIVSANAEHGMGAHNVYLGASSSVASDDKKIETQNESIVLRIPGEVTKEKDTYTSVITWQLLDEPS